MSDATGLTILAVVCMLAMAGFGRLVRGHWLAPSAFAPLLGGVYVTLPAIAAPDYGFSARSVWKIVSFVFVMQAGALATESTHLRKNRGRGSSPRDLPELRLTTPLTRRLLRLSLVCTVVSMIGTIYLGSISLRTYGLQTSLQAVIGLGPILSAERYTLGLSYSTLVRVLVAWVYPAGLLGGLVYPFLEGRGRLLAFAPFASAISLSIISAIRAGVLFTGVCWLTGFIAVKMYATRGRYRLTRSQLLIALGALVMTVIAFALAIEILRGGLDRTDDIVTTWQHVRPGALGYLAAFSDWETGGADSVNYGFYTFAGIFELAGWRQREIGIFVTPVNLMGGETNVYTVFRGLIEDFTYPGALGFVFLFGGLSGWGYRQVLHGRYQWSLALAACYAACIWAPIASFFVYNGLVLAWLTAAVAFLWPTHEIRYPVRA